MKKVLFPLLLLLLTLTSCIQEEKPSTKYPENYIVLDYLSVKDIIPKKWNEEDTSNSVKEITLNKNDLSLSINFVGKWRVSSTNEELMSKKDVNSYICSSSSSSLVIKKMIVEVFQAEIYVYNTSNIEGEKLNGKVVDPVHNDGSAIEYEINSSSWSLKPIETYVGSNICLYSVTFVI